MHKFGRQECPPYQFRKRRFGEASSLTRVVGAIHVERPARGGELPLQFGIKGKGQIESALPMVLYKFSCLNGFSRI